jgi:hypothetical protein
MAHGAKKVMSASVSVAPWRTWLMTSQAETVWSWNPGRPFTPAGDEELKVLSRLTVCQHLTIVRLRLRLPISEEFPKTQSIASLIVLKQLLNKTRELLNKATKWKPWVDNPFYRVRYTSVPLWRPWRDF